MRSDLCIFPKTQRHKEMFQRTHTDTHTAAKHAWAGVSRFNRAHFNVEGRNVTAASVRNDLELFKVTETNNSRCNVNSPATVCGITQVTEQLLEIKRVSAGCLCVSYLTEIILGYLSAGSRKQTSFLDRVSLTVSLSHLAPPLRKLRRAWFWRASSVTLFA